MASLEGLFKESMGDFSFTGYKVLAGLAGKQ